MSSEFDMPFPIKKEVFVSEDVANEIRLLQNWYKKTYERDTLSDSEFLRMIINLGLPRMKRKLKKFGEKK